MRILIVGGGIAAVYTANKIKELSPHSEVIIISDEAYMPYDRIHLCRLVNKSTPLSDITLELDPHVKVELNTKITSIDAVSKRVISEHAMFGYDKLIIATGSKPRTLFNIDHLTNASTFRSADDSYKISDEIKDKNVVIVGVGPIGLELLDTLVGMKAPKSMTLISRGEHLYDQNIDRNAIDLMQKAFTEDPRVQILFNDEIIDKTIEDNFITQIRTKQTIIDDPFVVFGVGISPNIDFAKDSLQTDKGILVNDTMQSSDSNIYAVGEAAQLSESGFITGHVKSCIDQSDIAVATILEQSTEPFIREVSIDALKVGSFMLNDVTSPSYDSKSISNETILITSKKENRIDQYIVNEDKLVRFIGMNTNIDLLRLSQMMQKQELVDPSYFYQNRLVSERGPLICSCEGSYELDLIDMIKENAVTSFPELKPFTKAGRVCGRCKMMISDLISQTPVDPMEAKRLKEERQKKEKEAEYAKIQARIQKYNTLHPHNEINTDNLESALEVFDKNREFNKWVSMLTADLKLHPEYEPLVKEGVEHLNKMPIIWLELADCSGNSEGFIKNVNPSVEDLILDYISLDYHELLMAASGDNSENALNSVIENDQYILMVEGAIPLGLEGNFLRIGAKGETGVDLLKRVAKDAMAVFAIGSCALDGGVVAAAPNPTGAVGVSEALGRDDIINLPGCPVNPINIVGTLLHFLMFDELPKLDTKNRPEWAYSYRIHDNCERRGHYDMDEFVEEWGDEGAKKGWCLFHMGCKGPYADLNCPLVKFNEGTSWPVQAGHGCIACGQGKIAFDKYANTRRVEEEENES
ncbi:hydrogenase small subunit [Sulfurovum sp. CS9]|uniref:hydrogenase small subunit n=1 Tax=Sulfurovum sp. CS9 TaxID=3391146 RepID=UPI0039E89EB2